jgi:hypothetical protein
MYRAMAHSTDPSQGSDHCWDSCAEGGLASRELAAHILSELGGWRLVPTTVLRDGPFGWWPWCKSG